MRKLKLLGVGCQSTTFLISGFRGQLMSYTIDVLSFFIKTAFVQVSRYGTFLLSDIVSSVHFIYQIISEINNNESCPNYLC